MEYLQIKESLNNPHKNELGSHSWKMNILYLSTTGSDRYDYIRLMPDEINNHISDPDKYDEF